MGSSNQSDFKLSNYKNNKIQIKVSRETKEDSIITESTLPESCSTSEGLHYIKTKNPSSNERVFLTDSFQNSRKNENPSHSEVNLRWNSYIYLNEKQEKRIKYLFHFLNNTNFKSILDWKEYGGRTNTVNDNLFDEMRNLCYYGGVDAAKEMEKIDYHLEKYENLKQVEIECNNKRKNDNSIENYSLLREMSEIREDKKKLKAINRTLCALRFSPNPIVISDEYLKNSHEISQPNDTIHEVISAKTIKDICDETEKDLLTNDVKLSKSEEIFTLTSSLQLELNKQSFVRATGKA